MKPGTPTLPLQVELNGSKLPIKDFSDYVNMFMRPTNNARKDQGQPELERFSHKTDRWEVVVSQSGGQFQQASSPPHFECLKANSG